MSLQKVIHCFFLIVSREMFVNQEEKEATDQELENLNRHFQAVKQQFDWVQKEENSPENMDEQSKMQDSVANQGHDPVNERSFILFSHDTNENAYY